MKEVEELLEQRGAEYGPAWQITGRWIVENARALVLCGDYAFCVIMVHNKLVRAQTSPFNPDHYLDALGYINLMLQDMEARDGVKPTATDQ